MADASPGTGNAPDIMNDHEFDPLQRRDTRTSKDESEVGIADTCRICRSEGTLEEPLFYPCKCSGSIKFVHQECLMEWLSHSHKKHCELCKTPFRFTKLYDAAMPKTLPWTVFIQRACLHTAMMFLSILRATLVSIVWLIVLPWLIRWGWRWMFWVADIGWAREAFVRKVQNQSAFSQVDGLASTSPADTSSILIPDTVYAKLEQIWENQFGSLEGFTSGRAMEVMKGMLVHLGLDFNGTMGGLNSTVFGPVNVTWPHADKSILSSITYISELTPNPALNRAILDIFEGQLITCVVITGFILVFLIREWVVQQQPLVNLDNLNNDEQARQRIERLGRERLRRQLELLDEARARLNAVETESRALTVTPSTEEWHELDGQADSPENIQALISRAMEKWQEETPPEAGVKNAFTLEFEKILKIFNNSKQDPEVLIRAVETMDDLPVDMKEVWLDALMKLARPSKPDNQNTPIHEQSHSASIVGIDELGSSSNPRRPPMLDRETSSRIARIRRTLEETDALLLDARNEDPPSRTSRTAYPDSTWGHADDDNAGREADLLDIRNAGETSRALSVTSIEGSWQDVTISAENVRMNSEIDRTDEIPITNAGPDAKVNIKRGGNGRLKTIPAPHQQAPRYGMDKEGLSSEHATSVSDSPRPANNDENSEVNSQTSNPLHPDGPEREPGEQDTFHDRVVSVFREEFGLEEAEGHGNQHIPEQPQLVEPEPLNEGPLELHAHNRPAPRPPTILQQLAEWFWGDIQMQDRGQEPAIPPNEERVNEINDIQARFVPVQNAHPIAAAPPAEIQEPAEHDPEVVAAAQQAGLDPEAIEDAEDLEGIFELIGLQGPIIGLFQTSCFCSVLVQGTMIAAVGLPYLWGKLVLSFLGSPVTFLVKFPLQTASFVADVFIDALLWISGWTVVGLTFLSNVMLSPFESLAGAKILDRVSSFGFSTAHHAFSRLEALFANNAASENMNWNWACLRGSVHSHSSLQNIQAEVNFVLNSTGSMITSVVDTISSGSISLVWQRSLNVMSHVFEIPARLLAGVEALEQYTKPLLAILQSLRSGALTFQTSSSRLDPSLVYWDSTDRALAVLTGYFALAALAAVYVALDRPITRTPSGQKTEKLVRDTLRQAGGVLKVILIISIEMLVFPLYCGLLLDLAFLPLFQGASMATRWAFAIRAPSTFCFVHWFVGTCYMFHFALFVGMCRKILRKGVLWFIRDPDDPTFHPVRDVLERNVTTQLRKIAFSALVYGALVILCLGGVIWSIGHVFDGIFPIYWVSTEPVLEFPMDLLLYNFITPLLIKLFKPSDAVHAMYAWWLRRCARVLRLSHFLFDDRRKDEEGRHVHKSWSSFLLMRKGDVETASPSEHLRIAAGDADAPEVYFERDGKYVLTPCNDQYRPPKPGEAFLYDTEDDVFIADKDGKRNDHFAKIYVPPSFRLRVTLFMVCLWMFSAFTGLCATLVPLVFGRRLFASITSSDMRVNDIYAYSAGAYIIFGALFVGYKYKSALRYLKTQAAIIDMKAWIGSATRYTLQVLKCIYVYGFLGLVLPVVFALILQFYLILPLHTYLVTSAASSTATALLNNGSASTNTTLVANSSLQDFVQLSSFSNVTARQPATALASRFADHSIHLLADYALGLLYVRIAVRFLVATPTSRAAEAFRRITEDGYLKPNARLATRFFVLPATLLAIVVLLTPLGVARSVIGCAALVRRTALGAATRAAVYRYAYPLTAIGVVMMFGLRELADATARWRARIRDEVYLVGERLHNFGEKKPPAGSRSVVRKER